MLSQSQFSPNCIDFQARFNHQRAQFKILINRFVPHRFIDRRNASNTKLADEDLLARVLKFIINLQRGWLSIVWLRTSYLD